MIECAPLTIFLKLSPNVGDYGGIKMHLTCPAGNEGKYHFFGENQQKPTKTNPKLTTIYEAHTIIHPIARLAILQKWYNMYRYSDLKIV